MLPKKSLLLLLKIHYQSCLKATITMLSTNKWVTLLKMKLVKRYLNKNWLITLRVALLRKLKHFGQILLQMLSKH